MLPFVSARSTRGGLFAASPAAPAAATGGVTRQSDLVHWWKLDDTSDEIGDATLTHVNGASIQSETAQFGSAWAGDGVGDYSYAENSLSMPLLECTVTGWVRLNDPLEHLGAVFGISDDKSGLYTKFGCGFMVFTGGAERIKFFAVYGSPGGSISTYAAAQGRLAEVDQWYFIAGTFSSSNAQVKMYQANATDGDADPVLETTVSIAADQTMDVNADSLTIGESNWYELNGYVDDVRIYDALLSLDDIKEIYNGGDGDL